MTHLPITHAELSRIVDAEWPEVARLARVDTARMAAGITQDGVVYVAASTPQLVSGDERKRARIARVRLLDALELRYLVIDREAGRVLVWAASGVPTREDPQAMVRLTDLPDDHPLRLRWDARVHAGIQERRREKDWPTQSKAEVARAQGLAKWRAAR